MMATTNAIDAMVMIFLLLVLIFTGREAAACAAFFAARDGVFLICFGGWMLCMLSWFLFLAARDCFFLDGSDEFGIFSQPVYLTFLLLYLKVAWNAKKGRD